MKFWKKSIFVVLDIALAIYLVLAVTSFNKMDDKGKICEKVNIYIADESTNGFLSAKEIKGILTKNKLYPWQQNVANISPRKIEELLKRSPFVNTAECYKTQNNEINITVTQRMPVIRIKSDNGDDYYIDEKGGEMPNSQYTSDLIIATGRINKHFARNYLSLLALSLMDDELWQNQIEQVNVLPDKSIEIVPRVGNHIVCLGQLPENKNVSKRQDEIDKFVKKKLSRLQKFYQHGLSQAGWNKYSYINLEFDNQIICKRNK